MKCSLACCILLIFSELPGQDLIFSQYYNSPIHTNPAFAGLETHPNFTSNYRIQWPSLNNAYETYAVTYDQYFRDMNSGFGFIALSDDQGDGTLKSTKIAGIYSYKVRFNVDWQIKFGLEAAYNQNRLDWDKLVFFDQIDPVTGPFTSAGVPVPSSEVRPESLNNSYLDISIGMLLYNPEFYVGFSMDHLNGAYAGFTNAVDDATTQSLQVLFSLQAGFQIVLMEDNKGNPSTFISPNMIFARQSDFNQLNVGAYMQINQLFGGAWVRHTLKNIDSFIFSFGVNLDYIKIGYSFDLTSSKLGLSTGGSHELGIAVGLRNLGKKESRMNDCLRLFR
ncbi:MAG: type IX secretion system membrane protein PorP/SprF [Bacteroidia bacterium]|nr:type IX secretion system membrane protein PorP/SprF [Bacteroidia bacterium]